MNRSGEARDSQLKYSMLNDDWEVGEDGSLTSPIVKDRPGQMVIFGPRIRNGSISADITILETQARREGYPSLEACLIVRYSGQDSYYYAGTGAFYAKFFIGKANPGPIWQLRAHVGSFDNVRKDKTYHLRLELNGSQFILYENDVQQLVLYDESYSIGQCGLSAWRTKARFENIRIVPAKPKAFLVMPFASELDFVHGVINQTVESYGIDCVRADEVAISRPVMDDVKKLIAEADLVIVDFTGKNPNVYYEAGLADAWKKDWIVLAQSSEDMTFDVRHVRSIRYTNTMGADKKLAEDLRRALEALGYSGSSVISPELIKGGTNEHRAEDQNTRSQKNPRSRRRRNSRDDDRRSARSDRRTPAK